MLLILMAEVGLQKLVANHIGKTRVILLLILFPKTTNSNGKIMMVAGG
jgi:hypothetical protein